MGRLLATIKQAGADFQRDECMLTGAALSYYTIFSLPPLLVLVFMVAGTAGVERTTIDRLVRDQLGIPATESAEGDRSALVAAAERTHDDSGGLLGRLIGFGLLAFSATGVLAQLQGALNRAWDVTPDAKQGGVLTFAVKRLLSLSMIVVFALLLLIALVITTLVDEATSWVVGDADGIAVVIAGTANFVLSAILAAILFAAVFKVLPDADLRWRHVWLGATVTSLLFVVGKQLIAVYLQFSNVGSQWGSAAGAMIGVLVWVYYNSLLVLFGAEFTQAWCQQHGDWPDAEQGATNTVDASEIEARKIPGEQDETRTSWNAVAASPPFESTASADGNSPPLATDSGALASAGRDGETDSNPDSNLDEKASATMPKFTGWTNDEERVFFKLQMTALANDPETTLGGIRELLEVTLDECTQFLPDEIVAEKLDELGSTLRRYVDEFGDQRIEFADLCDRILLDIARCEDLLDEHGPAMPLADIAGGPLTPGLELERGIVVAGDDLATPH